MEKNSGYKTSLFLTKVIYTATKSERNKISLNANRPTILVVVAKPLIAKSPKKFLENSRRKVEVSIEHRCNPAGLSSEATGGRRQKSDIPTVQEENTVKQGFCVKQNCS